MSKPPGTMSNPCDNQEQEKLGILKKRQREELPDHPDNKERINSWLHHRERVKQSKAIVDTSPPYIPPSTLAALRKRTENRLYGDRDALQAQNMRIIQRVGSIYLGGGYVDNRLDRTLHINSKGPKSRTFEELYRPIAETRFKHESIIKPIISRQKHLEDYEQNEKWMQQKSLYPLFWKEAHCTPFEAEAIRHALLYGSDPIVFFDIGTNGEVKGRVYIKLKPMSAPGPVESFIRACNQSKAGPNSFVCRQVDNMWPKMFWKIGKGIQGEYKEPFSPSNSRLKHDKAGIVSLINNGEDIYEGDFIITGRPLPPLNGVNLPIGKVIKGMHFLKSLSQQLNRRGMSFSKPIQIISSGFAPVREADHPESSDKESKKERKQDRNSGVRTVQVDPDNDDPDPDDMN